MSAPYIDAAVAARYLRKDLKRVFPGVKFSVRTSKYSGGASIDVGWVDGPTEAEVNPLLSGYRGARFDGSIDLQYSADSWYCPTHGSAMAQTYGHSYAEENRVGSSRCCSSSELVHFGSGYVFGRRDLSPEFTAELVAQVERETGETYSPQGFSHAHQEFFSTLVFRASRDRSKFERVSK